MIVGTVRCEGQLHLAVVRGSSVLDVTVGLEQLRTYAPDRLEQVLTSVGWKTIPDSAISLIALRGKVGVLVDALVGALNAEGLLQASEMPLDDAQWGIPVPRPGKIIGVGHNYADLLRDIGREPPPHPILFAKWPTTLCGAGDVVPLPPGLHEISYEAELAVIIGRGGRRIPTEQALDYVFGYSIANDVTAIDAVRADGQMIRGKNYDRFTPIGPWIVTTDEIPDPQALTIQLWQNGKVRQESSTRNMVFPVAELVAFISTVCALEPGDVILTGSPTGVARLHDPPAHLAPGDDIAIRIERVGILRHGVGTEAV